MLTGESKLTICECEYEMLSFSMCESLHRLPPVKGVPCL